MVGHGQYAFELHYDFHNLTTNKVDPQKKEGAVNTDSTPPQYEVFRTCPGGHVQIRFQVTGIGKTGRFSHNHLNARTVMGRSRTLAHSGLVYDPANKDLMAFG